MLYFNYLFKKTLNQFLAIISILITLIWFSRAIAFMRYITENGIGIGKFFYLFILILPWLLIFIIPVSMFIAVIMVYSGMIKTNEITILKNSGLTKMQISKPIIFLAILTSIFCFITSFYLMPMANKEMRLMRIDFANNYASLAFNPKTFETINDLTIYIKDRDQNNQLYGIMLNDDRSQKYSITITAQKGEIIANQNGVYLFMEDGTVQRFNYEKNNSEILNFDSYVFNLTRDKGKDSQVQWKAKERYFHELINYEDDLDENRIKKIRSEIHERLTYPLLPIVLSMIATAAILFGDFSRRGNLKNIVFASLCGILFMVLNIVSYELIENSAKFTPFLYINLITALFIALKYSKN